MLDKKLIKAEILWTRKCPLACSFCSMPNDLERAPVNLMIQGLHNLHRLGCEFIAIYGASPIYDMGGDDLCKFIHEAERIGILTTVITDGIAPKHKEKIESLYDAGLRSLTVSYDFNPYDKHSKAKSSKALDLVNWFSTLDDVRDVEIVATVTSQNWKTILDQLSAVTQDGKIWFSFDFVHPDLGHPGTKCKGDGKGFLMNKDDIKSFAKGMLFLKAGGLKIHQSDDILNQMILTPSRVESFIWNCATKSFPSWVTIDADGTVLPCDDFHTDRSFKVWHFDEIQFDSFSKFYKKEVQDKCNGCFWTTHYDAESIKSGRSKFTDYIHK